MVRKKAKGEASLERFSERRKCCIRLTAKLIPRSLQRRCRKRADSNTHERSELVRAFEIREANRGEGQENDLQISTIDRQRAHTVKEEI